MKKQNKNLKIGLIILAILLIIDQVTKIIAINTNVDVTIIKDIFNLKLVFNNGIAFGIGQGEDIATVIISNLIVLGIIIRFIILQKDRMDTVTMYGLFMILAGGFGNLIDRIFAGKVIDFIQILPSTNFPIFNLADVYIVIGWIILAFTFAMYTYKEIQERKKNKE